MASRLTIRGGSSMGAQTLRSPCLSATVPSICIRCQVSMFSTSLPKAGPNSDRNKKRGVSAIRRTGPRYPSAVSKEPLPRPVTDAEQRSKIRVNEKHGLWQFFDKEKNPFETPDTVAEHGRPWSVAELRFKSFEDLHCLWWVCVKERNRLITQEHERKKTDAGFGETEFEERDEVVRKTMRAIKHVLTERWYSYEDARKIAAKDPTLSKFLNQDFGSQEFDEGDAFEEEGEVGKSGEAESPISREKQANVIEESAPGTRITQEPLR